MQYGKNGKNLIIIIVIIINSFKNLPVDANMKNLLRNENILQHSTVGMGVQIVCVYLFVCIVA